MSWSDLEGALMALASDESASGFPNTKTREIFLHSLNADLDELPEDVDESEDQMVHVDLNVSIIHAALGISRSTSNAPNEH